MTVPVRESVHHEVASYADERLASKDPAATDPERIPGIVDHLRHGFNSGVLRSLDSRRVQLEALRRMLVEQEGRIIDALVVDLGKPPPEAFSLEFYATLKDIDDALKRLKAWNKPRRVGIPILVQPGFGRIPPTGHRVHHRPVELPHASRARPPGHQRWAAIVGAPVHARVRPQAAG